MIPEVVLPEVLPSLLSGEVKTVWIFKYKMQSEGQISLRFRIAFSHVFQSTEILDVSYITIPVSDLVFLKFLI